MAVLLRALRALFPLLRLRAWMLSGIILLGVLAALSEGLSIMQRILSRVPRRKECQASYEISRHSA